MQIILLKDSNTFTPCKLIDKILKVLILFPYFTMHLTIKLHILLLFSHLSVYLPIYLSIYSSSLSINLSINLPFCEVEVQEGRIVCVELDLILIYSIHASYSTLYILLSRLHYKVRYIFLKLGIFDCIE
jgi:hypothetical protein